MDKREKQKQNIFTRRLHQNRAVLNFNYYNCFESHQCTLFSTIFACHRLFCLNVAPYQRSVLLLTLSADGDGSRQSSGLQRIASPRMHLHAHRTLQGPLLEMQTHSYWLLCKCANHQFRIIICTFDIHDQHEIRHFRATLEIAK